MTIKNIPVGYKDSPLGIIPMEWEVKRFRDIGNFLRNNTLSRDKMSESEGCIQNIHYGDILIKYKEILKVSKTNIPWIVEDRKYSPLGDMLQNGDIVISDTAEDYTVGKATELMEINGAFVVAGLHTMPFRPLSDLFSPRFLGYYLNSMAYRFQLYALVQGIKVCSISKKAMSGTFLIVPPLAEQEKIAEILSTWDKAIEKQTQLIQKLELRKKGLMQQLLTAKRRLPGFSEPWQKVKLGEICLIKKGKPLSFTQIKEGIYPVIAGGKTSPYSHNEYTDERVITISASGAYAGFVSLHESKIWASDCSVIYSRNGLSILKYIYALLSYKQPYIYSLQVGGAQPHVFPKDISNIIIKIPKEKEQIAIAEVLTATDREIELAQHKLELLRQQKRGLMQQLLTGKKRVKI